MTGRRVASITIILFSLWCLLSCGIEDSPYLDFVPVRDVTIQDRDVTIRLPSYSSYFDNFVIFYRIYISGTYVSGIVGTSQHSEINPALGSDYNSIYPSTNQTSTSVNTSNLANSFFSRNYHLLTLVGADINSILNGSYGSVLKIMFPQDGDQPYLSLDGGGTYILQRAIQSPGNNFNPKPDRYFLNHEDLYNSSNATKETNADVANRSISSPPNLYTYVSMYIAATGRSYLTTIYSQPTFIGIFALADRSP